MKHRITTDHFFLSTFILGVSLLLPGMWTCAVKSYYFDLYCTSVGNVREFTYTKLEINLFSAYGTCSNQVVFLGPSRSFLLIQVFFFRWSPFFYVYATYFFCPRNEGDLV